MGEATDLGEKPDLDENTDLGEKPDLGEKTGAEVGQLSEEEIRERRCALDALLDLMRPAVQSDGGDLVLLDADVESGVIQVQLQGACSSCAISSTTLQAGVERILRDRLCWVTEVRGAVDDSMDLVDSQAMGRGAYVPRAR